MDLQQDIFLIIALLKSWFYDISYSSTYPFNDNELVNNSTLNILSGFFLLHSKSMKNAEKHPFQTVHIKINNEHHVKWIETEQETYSTMYNIILLLCLETKINTYLLIQNNYILYVNRLPKHIKNQI